MIRRLASFALLFLLAASSAAFEAVAIREYLAYPDDREIAPRRPDGVALLADGTLAVTDESGRKVFLTRPDGARVVIEARPTGVAAFGDILYVAETRRIRRFRSDGTELPGLADDETINFGGLRGLAVDARGNVYAADRSRDVVWVVSPDGVPLGAIGENAGEPARLANPVDVTVGADGRVFVADAGNRRIAIFSIGGWYLGAIDSIREPRAVSVDQSGLLYVAEGSEARILRYDTKDMPRGAFGAKGRNRGQFRELLDVDAGADGLLRVLDGANRTLHVLAWPAPADQPPPPGRLPLSARWNNVVPFAGAPIGHTLEGDLIVAVDGRVAILDSTLATIRQLASVELRDPVCATVAPDGRLYVADRAAGEIRVFDAAGAELFAFGRGTRVLFFRGGDGRLIKPRHVAVSRGGMIAITDVGKVELFGPDGAFMNALGSDGDENGEMKRPIGAVFTPGNAIIVADDKLGRIAEYDASGRWTGRAFGGLRPLAIAGDEEGRVYVLDENGPRLRVFSPDLLPLMTIGADGLGVGGLRNATALVLAGDRLFVTRHDGLARLTLDLPPPPPDSVSAEPRQRAIQLSWDSATVAYAVAVEAVFTEDGRERREVRPLPRNTLTIDELRDETEYTFRLRLLNRLGLGGAFSAPVTARTPALTLPPPSEPHVAFLPDLSGVSLRWDPAPSPHVTGYIVEGRTGGDFVEKHRTSATACVLPPDAARVWRVRAVAANGREGPPSREVTHLAAEGLAALGEGSFALAAARLQSAIVVEPRTAPLRRALGVAAERLERFAEATTAYQDALALDPADTLARLGLVRLALLRGDTATARSGIDRIPAAPNDPEYLHAVGLAALAEENYDTAVRRLAEAVALAPTTRHREALARAEEARRQFGENRPRLEIVAATIRPIFPILYKAYMSEPIGEAIVRNAGRAPLERIRFSIFIRGAMDFPSDTVLARLLPGETILVPIRAELANSILFSTEDDTKLAELRLTYYRAGDPVEVRQSVPFRLHARTALTWDEPRRVAAFVTTRAPSVAQFARNALGAMRPHPDVNAPAQTVILMRAALAALGLRYQADPEGPFQGGATDRDRIDHVQLPEETLRTRAGDCDDLVVLLAALLEHLGVRTAIADLPGHLLLLVDAELPVEAAALVAAEGMWIERHGSVWLPIETTLLEASFEEAVRAGMAALAKDRAVLFEPSEAWNAFPPVTSLESVGSTPAPERDAIRRRYDPDEERLRRRTAGALVALVELEGAEGMNARGAILGRLGLLDEAEALLRDAGETAEALNNLGNLLLLRGDREAARALYEKAAALDPEDEGIRRNLERLP